MPRSTRSTTLLPTDEGESAGGEKRSTRRKASEGGGQAAKSPPPKKKARRTIADDDNDEKTSKKKSPPQRARKTNTSPSKAPPAAAGSAAAVANEAPTQKNAPAPAGKKAATATAAAAAASEKNSSSAAPRVCIICKKNSLDDPRNMISFDDLGTFHVFCGKICAISDCCMPQFEIKEKVKIRPGQSRAIARALATCKTAVADDGKVYVSLPDYKEKLEAAKLSMPDDDASPASSSRKKGSKGQVDPLIQRAIENATKARRSLAYVPVYAPNAVAASAAAATSSVAGLASLATAAGMKKAPEIRRRPCICGHADCYSVLIRWVKSGDSKRCGYVSLPSWSAKGHTDRGVTVNQFRELAFQNLLGDKNLAVEESSNKPPRKYVAFHHFEDYQLLPNNKGLVEFIRPQVAQQHGLTQEYQIISGVNRGKYVPSPRRPWTDMMMELVIIERQRLYQLRSPSSAAAAAAAAASSSKNAAELNAEESQALKERLDDIPEDIEELKSRYIEAETALTKQAKRSRELEAELANTRMSMHAMQQNQTQMKGLAHKMYSLAQKM